MALAGRACILQKVVPKYLSAIDDGSNAGDITRSFHGNKESPGLTLRQSS